MERIISNIIERLCRLTEGAGEGTQTNRLAIHGLAATNGGPANRRVTNSGMVEMVLSHTTEGSILLRPNIADYVPFSVGGRMRRATCSGVAWFRGYHLAVVNLYGCHLRIYRFHPNDDSANLPARLELLHEVSVGIEFPEKVAAAPDGRLLAVTQAWAEVSGVSLFSIDAQSPTPTGDCEILRPRSKFCQAFHGVSFTPDSRHLAFTEVAEPGYVEVVSVVSSRREQTCWIANRLAPLKPKSIAFSGDGKFAAIAMGYNGTLEHQSTPTGGMLMIHRFDSASGVIAPEPLAEFRGEGKSLATSDMCTFLPTKPGEHYTIAVVDQATDAILAYEFDAEKQTLIAAGVFADGLSFPHDVAVSADGQFVAIANYGDDTLCIGSLRTSPRHSEWPGS